MTFRIELTFRGTNNIFDEFTGNSFRADDLSVAKKYTVWCNQIGRVFAAMSSWIAFMSGNIFLLSF